MKNLTVGVFLNAVVYLQCCIGTGQWSGATWSYGALDFFILGSAIAWLATGLRWLAINDINKTKQNGV